MFALYLELEALGEYYFKYQILVSSETLAQMELLRRINPVAARTLLGKTPKGPLTQRKLMHGMLVTWNAPETKLVEAPLDFWFRSLL